MLNFPLKSSGDPPDGDKDTDEHRMNEREREGGRERERESERAREREIER